MSKKEMDPAESSANLLEEVFIVGIGASAGGLEAITEFFDNVPQEAGCAFVIIQHLSPDYKSLMPELLSKHTNLPIIVAEDNMFVKSGHIYLIPHRKNMTIGYGKLKLKDKDLIHSPNMTIDIFFKSLAEYKKDKAIGVILSGTGTDGAKGVTAMKNAGGFILVQDPLTAKFDGMPNSAIATGSTDFVLAPEMMFDEIGNYIRQTPSEKNAIEGLIDNNEDTLRQILDLIKIRTGNDFTMYKRPTLIRRIGRRVGFKNFKSLEDYKEFLLENEEEVFNLSKEFLIGVTRFFRDYPAFDVLAKNVLPKIIANKNPKEPIKVWVAGCSTGEEAYTLAILFQEALSSMDRDHEVKIFATDLDKDSIERASRGIYPDKSIKEIPEERYKKYFEKVGEDYKVIPSVRKMIIFAVHDLIKDAPFSKMDLVTCRNLLIYLGSDLQKRAMVKFHFSLNLNGFLFLGSSENIGDLAGSFSELSKKWKIYQNVNESKSIKFETFYSSTNNIRAAIERPAPVTHVPQNQYADLITDGLMSLSGYSVIFVNEQLEVIHAIGEFRKYIQLPEKTLDFNVLKMVTEDLSILLGAAIRKAFKNNEWVNINGNRIKESDHKKIIDISIQPSFDRKKGRLAAIFLKERNVEQNKSKDKKEIYSDSKNEELIVLKHELGETKENLQSLIEELETANEEMQSANEELTSANEELQSTNEELQSLNEELHTVNSEHQQKIRELFELNDDLNNYFSSTDIGQVFVDSDLLIRKFTPSIEQHINLIQKDIGRPISHISNNIKYDRLIDDLIIVSTQGVKLEREIQMRNGKWFLMKLMPYVRHNKKIDGVVLAFVDIDKMKMLNDHLSGILKSSLNGIMTFAAVKDNSNRIIDFEYTLINPAAEKILSKKASSLLGKQILNEMPGVQIDGLFEKFVEVADSGRILHMEHFYAHEGMNHWLEIAAVKLEEGLTITFADITEKKVSQEKIKTAFNEIKNAQENLKRLNNELELRVAERTKELYISEERFRLLSLATNDAIWDWDLVTDKVWLNEGFKTIFGHVNKDNQESIDFLFKKIHPEDKARVVDGIQGVIKEGENLWSGEYRLLKDDGTFAFILDRAYVLRYEDDNNPYRMIGSMVDLTNVKKAQTQLEVTNENLKRINNDLDNFIYTASHDLKAPISNIEGLMNTMNEILSEHQWQSKELVEVLDLINKSVNKFKETIKDLTEIAKVQKENIEDLESVSLVDVIEDVRFVIKDMFIKSNAVINYNLKEPSVVFSKKNLKSIFYNLLSNAIKYKTADHDPVINIYSERAGNYTVVGVKDNGLGIPKEKQSKAFEMFKRMHDHVEGTGIGLYIVKRAMENAGGKVVLESEAGKGCEFKLYFQNPLLSKEKVEQADFNSEKQRRE